MSHRRSSSLPSFRHFVLSRHNKLIPHVSSFFAKGGYIIPPSPRNLSRLFFFLLRLPVSPGAPHSPGTTPCPITTLSDLVNLDLVWLHNMFVSHCMLLRLDNLLFFELVNIDMIKIQKISLAFFVFDFW